MSDKQQQIDFRNLRTFKQLAAESNGTFTEPALRWMRFNAEHNGFANAFVEIGGRVLIDTEKFNQCLAAQSRVAA